MTRRQGRHHVADQLLVGCHTGQSPCCCPDTPIKAVFTTTPHEGIVDDRQRLLDTGWGIMRTHTRLPKYHSHNLLGKGLADLPGQSQRFKVQMQTRCHLP
jgi:hypothetical protein